ncbi:MAG: ATPase, T2SS/T4P/T4SS family [Bryobacteraceae bacterium]
MSAAAISRGELLLTYIQGLEPYLNHPDVSEIMIDPEDDDPSSYVVSIEENGVMREVTSEVKPIIRESDLMALGRGLARNSLRRELNKENPMLSATLENGSRIAITIPPAADGVMVTIRNYRERPFTVEELIERGTITRKAAQVAQEAIEQRRNILISGGNGTGKSTLLNTLAGAYIPRDRRVIVLEDAARDIKLPYHRIKGFLRCGEHASMSKMIEQALRHKIVHVIMGEVRGEEGLDLLTALNTGHSGSMATIHADSGLTVEETGQLTLDRLTTCATMAETKMNYRSIRMMIANSIHYVMHVRQDPNSGARRMAAFVRVDKYDPVTDTFQFTAIH